MNRKNSIQLKAAFLLIAFSMNTVIGVACAVGLDMGFNTHHHDGNETTFLKTSHHHDTSHHNGEANNDHQKSKDCKDNCCNDQVMKFSQLDKSVPQPLNVINPIFLTAFVSTYYSIDVLNTSYAHINIKYFVRSYHPPIPDIRIVIQSFQI
jgi:hypothetical protein